MESAFKKVLVANRGEIAIRITRACQELGMGTVALYSDDDKQSFYYRIADEAIHIPGTGARATYLNIEKVLAIAAETGCDAVHPGYGFLSENPDFVVACEASGIKFIGPTSACMKIVGNKAGIKQVMTEVGIPALPSIINETDPEKLKKLAAKMGFPVMVKPSFGGGGKGMRIVQAEAEIEDAIHYASSIGQSAFRNPEFYIEKFLERPRHIEVQILADGYGNVLAFGERECSIQRNHQKLIEETPSPALDKKLRARVVELAQKAAKTINYENAGTIEFLYQDGQFYFLEVNARIQVEHSVTELVTGIDLVKEQIRIAAGNKVPFRKDYISPRGWAIQCRINAEDPENNFMPCPGKITGYRSPGGLGVRVDTGIFMGYSIPVQYDSLLSKLSVWGRDRDEAVSRMRRVLSEYVILGVKTTMPLFRAVFREADFIEGKFDTRYIEKHIDGLNQEMKRIEREEKSHEEMLAAIFQAQPDDEASVPKQEMKREERASRKAPAVALAKTPETESRKKKRIAAITAAVTLAMQSDKRVHPQRRPTTKALDPWTLSSRLAHFHARLPGGAQRRLRKKTGA